MKLFYIIELTTGAGLLPISLVAFLVRHACWNARFHPNTRASMMPEEVHIKGKASALFLFF
jgi:hypothetical protein